MSNVLMTFTGVDGTNLDGLACDSGQVGHTYQWDIQGGEGRFWGAYGDSFLVYDAAAAGVTVSVVLRATPAPGTSMGLSLRSDVGAQNRFRLLHDGTTLTLNKITAGVAGTPLASAACALGIGDTLACKVDAAGNFTPTINGATIPGFGTAGVYGPDTSFQTQTFHGLAAAASTPNAKFAHLTANAIPIASSLSLDTVPAFGAAGLAFRQQPVVSVRDGAGLKFAGAGTVITASLFSGTGALIGTTTASTDATGTATFATLGVSLAGVKTIRFSGAGFTVDWAGGTIYNQTDPVDLVFSTQPVGYTSQGLLATQPVVTVRDYTGATVTGSSAIIAIACSVVSSSLYDQTERLETTHTVQAGTTTTAVKVSPALSFPVALGSADYTGKGYALKIINSHAATPIPQGGEGLATQNFYNGVALKIASNTGTDTLNLESASDRSLEAGDTIQVRSGHMPAALYAQATSGVAAFSGIGIDGYAQTRLVATSPGLQSATSNLLTATGSWEVDSGLSELPRAVPDVTIPSYTTTYTVKPGGGGSYTTIQQAYDQAVALNSAAATRILVDVGYAYAEKLQLKNRTNSGLITIEASVLPAMAGLRPLKLNFTGGVTLSIEDPQGVVQCDASAHHVRLIGIHIAAPKPANEASTEIFNVVNLAEPTVTGVAGCPHHITLDRCWIQGVTSTTAFGTRRGIWVGGNNVALIESLVTDIHEVNNGDTQAVGGYAFVGPILLRNSYLESAGENLLFGGSDWTDGTMNPADITITKCHFAKPANWKNFPAADPNQWKVKNLLEFKNARRALIEGNVFENAWIQSQSGQAIFLGTAIQGGGAYWTGVCDITVRYNVIRNVGIGIQTTGANGQGYTTFGTTSRRLTIRDNLMVNVGSGYYIGPSGSSALITSGNLGQDLWIAHNTGLATESTNPGLAGNDTGITALGYSGPGAARVHFNDNILSAVPGGYGLTFTNYGGDAAITAYFSDGSFNGNVLPGYAYNGPSNGWTTTVIESPATVADVGFASLSGAPWEYVDPDIPAANLALSNTSPYRAGGAKPATDAAARIALGLSGDRGADMTALRAAIAGAWQPGEVVYNGQPPFVPFIPVSVGVPGAPFSKVY